MKIELTDFVKRQWKSDFSGTKMNNVVENDFLKAVNIASFHICKDSQFNFCKYIFIDNSRFDLDVKLGTIPIDYTIYQYIQSGYFSRTDEELSVLSRWVKFPPNTYTAPRANYIGLVLYSREQLLKEYNADPAIGQRDMNGNRFEQFELSVDCDYGIVAIMGLTEPEMEPMPPITHMRNALGKEHGGNGEPINIEEYQKSVEFWSKRILIK